MTIYQKIIGITLIGRETIDRPNMNDECHDNGAIRRVRRL
jgi:hypothetical protein